MGVICVQRGQLSVKKKINVGLSPAIGKVSVSAGADELPPHAVSRSISAPIKLIKFVILIKHLLCIFNFVD